MFSIVCPKRDVVKRRKRASSSLYTYQKYTILSKEGDISRGLVETINRTTDNTSEPTLSLAGGLYTQRIICIE
jgi:hypothetical protein